MGPCAANPYRCSVCGEAVPAGDDWIDATTVVRSAVKEPVLCLHAVFCAEHEEARQRWLEGLNGLRRGTRVRMDKWHGGDEATVLKWFDEESFVDEHDYVRSVTGIKKGAPVAPTLF